MAICPFLDGECETQCELYDPQAGCAIGQIPYRIQDLSDAVIFLSSLLKKKVT